MSIGARIKRARTMANMSQRDLAKAAKVSAMAISKYERDMDIPGSEVLIRLSKALEVKIEYFFRIISVTLSPAINHDGGSLLPGRETRIRERVLEGLERYLDIEDLIERSVPLSLPQKPSISTLEDTEDAALLLRTYWHLGHSPIENLAEVCEEHGLKVGLLSGHKDFDALTFWANDTIPVIILHRDMPGEHHRLYLARELGYLFLNLCENVDPEKATQRFARALLVPRPSAEFELGSKRDALSHLELHTLKHKYGLSLQDWIYRAKDLGILSERAAARILKQFRERGREQEDTKDALPPEAPHRFYRLVMQAVSEDEISRSRAAELLGMAVDAFALGGYVESHGGLSIEMCG
jgi:transcriptional regulator with XRE-family HTH domain